MKKKTELKYLPPMARWSCLDLEGLICGSFRAAPTVDELDNKNVGATESYLEENSYIEF